MSTTCLKTVVGGKPHVNHMSENCGRGESPMSTTCLKTVVGGKQGHALCKICLLQQSLFVVSQI